MGLNCVERPARLARKRRESLRRTAPRWPFVAFSGPAPDFRDTERPLAHRCPGKRPLRGDVSRGGRLTAAPLVLSIATRRMTLDAFGQLWTRLDDNERRPCGLIRVPLSYGESVHGPLGWSEDRPRGFFLSMGPLGRRRNNLVQRGSSLRFLSPPRTACRCTRRASSRAGRFASASRLRGRRRSRVPCGGRRKGWDAPARIAYKYV